MKTMERTYPAVDEVFELTLDGDATDPIEMVRNDGYGEPEKWRYTGKRVTGKRTRRFKLVQIGYRDGPAAIRKALKRLGRIPEGQWREAFRACFPKADRDSAFLIADYSWLDPDRQPRLPYIDTDGRSNFGEAGVGRGDELWLVELTK